MKKLAILCVILSSLICGCTKKNYEAFGDNKFDLVFITSNDTAKKFWEPLTNQVDSYFGTVIVPLSTDSVKAISQLQKMMEERQPSTLTVFYTSESEKICQVFCSNNKGKISMIIPVDDPNIWADILPGYMDATKEFYSTYEQRLDLLSNSPFNNDDTTQCVWNYNLSKEETERIANYFRLDTLICEGMNTWEKALNTGKFVSDNIPHGNQKSQPEQKDAITIWEFTQNIEPAVNCRLHSFITSQLLTAIGIKNRILTCLPADSTDTDCHVINIVWLPELNKWAMLDTDQRMVAIDEKGTPLSPFEMRDKYIKGEHFTLMVNYTEPMDIMDYYTSYMAKNTYWFASPVDYTDTKQNCLVPKGMTQWGYKENFITTESELRFTKE